MTQSESPFGEQLAGVILEYLWENPDECLVVTGRIGGQPNVRFDPDEGRYEFATWTAAGVMKGYKDSEDVRGLIQGGPRMEIEPVEDVEAWEAPEADWDRGEPPGAAN